MAITGSSSGGCPCSTSPGVTFACFASFLCHRSSAVRGQKAPWVKPPMYLASPRMNSGGRRPEDTRMEPGTRHQSSGSCGMWRSGCPQSRSPFVCLSLRKVCTPQSAQRDHASSWRQRGTPGKGRMDWGGPPGRRTVSSAGKEQRQQTRGTREDFGKCWD